MAIGFTKMSTADMRSINKGIAVSVGKGGSVISERAEGLRYSNDQFCQHCGQTSEPWLRKLL